MLRLHKRYSIPSTWGFNKKLTQQYVCLVCISKKIGRLAYRLAIFPHKKIHPVFLVTQLEPAPPPSENPFHRSFPNHPPSVFVEGNTNAVKSFEVERLLNERTVQRGCGRSTEYLIRWKKYRPKWDRWYNVKDLDNAADLMSDYNASLQQT